MENMAGAPEPRQESPAHRSPLTTHHPRRICSTITAAPDAAGHHVDGIHSSALHGNVVAIRRARKGRGWLNAERKLGIDHEALEARIQRQIGDRMFENEEDHRVALAAYQTLEKANFVAEGICEDCAVAMVNDGRCDKCNVSFEDGRFADGGCAKKGQSAGEKPKGNKGE